MNDAFDVKKLFTSIGYIAKIQEPIRLMTTSTNSLVQSLVSVERLQRFLKREEKEFRFFSGEGTISLQNCYFSYQRSDNFKFFEENDNNDLSVNILKDINLSIESKELVGITGNVNSGKSSLLKSILGCLRKVSGEMEVKGTVAYLGQEVWIQEGTIRSNIILDKAFNEELFDKIVNLCQLTEDLNVMEKSDMTMLTTNGNSLSGGQKARIGLARVLYAESDIILVDSPLSALDAKTSSSIMNKVFKEYTRNKTVIFTTQNAKLLTMMDRVIVLNEGKVSWSGSSKDFAKYEMKEYPVLTEKDKIEEEPSHLSQFYIKQKNSWSVHERRKSERNYQVVSFASLHKILRWLLNCFNLYDWFFFNQFLLFGKLLKLLPKYLSNTGRKTQMEITPIIATYTQE